MKQLLPWLRLHAVGPGGYRFVPAMPKPRRPHVASPDEIRFTRNGDEVIIQYADPTVATTHLKMGKDKLDQMTDEELLEFWNEHIEARDEHMRTYEYVAVEVPVGKPQVRYFEKGDQWVPRGSVLRCEVLTTPEDVRGREALVRYALRPPLAQERLHIVSDDLVRIELRRPFRDGTLAVDLDPLSLLCRLAAAVPPPRSHTVRYAGVVGAASKWRALVVPPPPQSAQPGQSPHQPTGANCQRPATHRSPISSLGGIDETLLRPGR
jgi:hypothetical protein